MSKVVPVSAAPVDPVTSGVRWLQAGEPNGEVITGIAAGANDPGLGEKDTADKCDVREIDHVRVVYKIGPASVNLFWVDVASVVGDFLQVYGIVWILSTTWSWPKLWLKGTAFTTITNLDVWAVWMLVRASQNQDSVDGSIPPYILLFLLGVFLAFVFIDHVTLKTIKHRGPYASRAIHAKALYRKKRLKDFLFAPMCILLFRSMICRGETSHTSTSLELNAALACGTSAHVLMQIFVTTPLLLGILVVLYDTYFLCESILTTKDESKHEHTITRKEIEWVLEISPEWFLDHYTLLSSYRRPCALYRFHVLMKKAFIVAVVFILRGNPDVHGPLLLGVFVVSSIRLILQPPFRSSPCNVLAISLESLLCINAYLGCIKAVGVNNALTKTSSMFYCLITINVIGVVVSSALTIIVLRRAKAQQYNPAVTMKGSVWPTNRNTIVDIVANPRCQEWIKAIFKAQDIIDKSNVTSEILHPVGTLESSAKKLEAFVLEAQQEKHILTQTLQDTLDMVRSNLLDDRLVHTSILPHSHLEQSLATLAAQVKRLELQNILMSPFKVRVLSKLSALRAWKQPVKDA
mmetsp:Transcript_8335/g.15547  ORF Transcript_8335/g.15547 Transcript_8335/m.15547 type:complete len:577 (-) Transcript_8335:233-1963(-)